jgi:hypothetical protein
MKYRVIFRKIVYAYLDIEAENESDLKDIVWEEEWQEDKFNYPDSDWEISSIKEVKQ